MSNALPQILAILGRTEADFHADPNQMRDRPVTWEQVLAIAALVDGRRVPVSADDVTDAMVEAFDHVANFHVEYGENIQVTNTKEALQAALDIRNQERGHDR